MSALAALPFAVQMIKVLAPHAKLIVKGAEKIFGPKTGDSKFKWAYEAVSKVAETFSTAGQLQGVASEQDIARIVQSTVDELKARGELDGPAAALERADRRKQELLNVIEQAVKELRESG